MSYELLIFALVPAYLGASLPGFYLYALQPKSRKLEIFVSLMCVSMSVYALLLYARLTMGFDHDKLIRYSHYIYWVSAVYGSSYFHFMAVALNMERSRIVMFVDAFLVSCVVGDIFTGFLLSDTIRPIPISDNPDHPLFPLSDPSLFGIIASQLIILLALYLVFKLGREILLNKRQELWPLFLGSLGFGVALSHDALVIQGWFAQHPIIIFGFGLLLLSFIVYLLRQMVSNQSQLILQTQQLSELTNAQNEFFSVAGHELQTPVTTMLGYLDMLSEEKLGEMPESYRTPIERMRQSSRRLQRLTSSILDVGRLQRDEVKLNYQRVDAVHLTEKVIKETRGFWSGMKQEVRLEVQERPEPIHADPDRVRQIIFNLLANSIKYTPEEGEILISIRPKPNGVAIEISDSSPGLSVEELRHIFDPFYVIGGSERHQSHPDDTCGLGLYIAKNLIELSGGKISVHSSPGEGARFIVALIDRAPQRPDAS